MTEKKDINNINDYKVGDVLETNLSGMKYYYRVLGTVGEVLFLGGGLQSPRAVGASTSTTTLSIARLLELNVSFHKMPNNQTEIDAAIKVLVANGYKVS